MADDSSFQSWIESQGAEKDENIDLKKLFFRMLSYWYYFIIALIVSLACAHFYNKYTTPIYNISTTVLISEENPKLASMNTDKILEGFGLSPDIQNVDNQLFILSSYTLVGKTLDKLSFDIDYNNKGLSYYPNSPIRVVPEKPGKVPFDVEFTLSYRHGNIFFLETKSDSLPFPEKAFAFGEIVKTPKGNFRVERVNDTWPSKKDENQIHFTFNSRNRLLENYCNRLKVEPASKKSTILAISLQGTNAVKEMAFLNKLTEEFLNINLEKKNKEAVRTVQFIDDQLIGISDSLVIAEDKLQQFKSKNKVMDLSAQGQVIIDQAMKLENDKAQLVLQANYYKYLAGYLKKDNAGEVPIAPATQGIDDPGLISLVAGLADLQDKYYSKATAEKNPMKGQIAQRLRNLKDALMETLNGLRKANDLAMLENSDQIVNLNAQASALPATERQLLGIERKFKLNDELYTFLVQKRAEAQIQKASNTPDNEVVDPARPDTKPVSPKKLISYLVALMAGFGFPFIWIWVVGVFDNKITDEDDIKKISDLPLAGHVPHSLLITQNVVFDDPHSQVTESFRTLRTKMQFFTREIKAPVILITSSIPGEGKTFTAINLASVYSLMGKKTVLIGFDLRRPKTFSDFGLVNEKGISTWLIGKDGLDEVINKTAYTNLDIILAGVLPPNPAELIASEKTGELFAELKKRYDYIIVDSAPMGSISDAYSLVPYSDAILLIVRDGITFKHSLEKTISEVNANKLTNISILENDINFSKLVYRYGYRYGYPYDNYGVKKGLFQFFKRKKYRKSGVGNQE